MGFELKTEQIEDEPIEDELKDDDLFKDELKDDGFGDDLGFSGFGESTQTPLERHADLLKKLTNFNPFLKDTINNWLGLIWNEKESKWVQDPHKKPLMNIHGANWCIGFLRNYARENNIITNIQKQEYQYLIYDVIETLWLNLGTRRREFGINNSGDVQRICVELEHSIQLVLMGAGDGKYNQLLQTTVNRSETVSPAPYPQNINFQKPQKQNMMQKFKRFMGG